jgi:hypothetical protein
MKKTSLSISILFSCIVTCFAQQEVVTTTSTTTVTNGGIQNMSMGVNGQPIIIETVTPQMNMNVSGTSSMTTTTVNNGGVVPAQQYNNCMVSEPQFDDMKRAIASQTYEDVKVNEATQIMNTHCLASWQVRDIMRLFTYENNRLVFAQRAYSRTVDPANYYQVNEAFEFPSSVNQLNASIGQR